MCYHKAIKSNQLCGRERGAALFISLVMLMLITMLSVTAFRTSTVEEQISGMRRADTAYLESATRIMELAQKAVEIYRRANSWEKREILDHLVSNTAVRDKTVCLKLRKPFDSWSKLAAAANSGNARSEWYPQLNNFRTAVIASLGAPTSIDRSRDI